MTLYSCDSLKQLEALPENIKSLYIDCFHLELSDFLDIFQQAAARFAHSLETLRIAFRQNNPVTAFSVPNEIAVFKKFPHLKSLSLELWGGSKLPNWLLQANNLRYLSITDGQLSAEHINIFSQMPLLEELHLNECGLDSLPPSLFRLKHLRVLSCHGNRFKVFPAALGTMPALTHIDFSQNRISELPIDRSPIWENCVWEGLNLYDNNISKLPSGLFFLPHINYIDLTQSTDTFNFSWLDYLLSLPDLRFSPQRVEAAKTHLRVLGASSYFNDDYYSGVIEVFFVFGDLRCLQLTVSTSWEEWNNRVMHIWQASAQADLPNSLRDRLLLWAAGKESPLNLFSEREEFLQMYGLPYNEAVFEMQASCLRALAEREQWAALSPAAKVCFAGNFLMSPDALAKEAKAYFAEAWDNLDARATHIVVGDLLPKSVQIEIEKLLPSAVLVLEADFWAYLRNEGYSPVRIDEATRQHLELLLCQEEENTILLALNIIGAQGLPPAMIAPVCWFASRGESETTSTAKRILRTYSNNSVLLHIVERMNRLGYEYDEFRYGRIVTRLGDFLALLNSFELADKLGDNYICLRWASIQDPHILRSEMQGYLLDKKGCAPLKMLDWLHYAEDFLLIESLDASYRNRYLNEHKALQKIKFCKNLRTLWLDGRDVLAILPDLEPLQQLEYLSVEECYNVSVISPLLKKFPSLFFVEGLTDAFFDKGHTAYVSTLRRQMNVNEEPLAGEDLPF